MPAERLASGEPLWPAQLPTETAFEWEALKAWLRERPRPAVPEPLLELAERNEWLERGQWFDWQERIAPFNRAEKLRLTLEQAYDALTIEAIKLAEACGRSKTAVLKASEITALLAMASDPANAPRERTEWALDALSPEEKAQFRLLIAKAKKVPVK